MALKQNNQEEASASSFSKYLVRPVVWLSGAVSTATILVLFVVTIYAIIMRYVIGTPSLWADEVTGWGLVALVMLGTAEAYRRGDHISVDILSTKATGFAKKLIAYVSDLAVLVFGVVLGTSTWEAIAFARDFGSYTTGNIEIETWLLQIPMVIGSVLLGLTAVTRIAERAIGART